MSHATQVGLGLGLVLGVLVISAAPAFALSDVAIGILDHNIQVTDAKNANKEDGPALEAQLTWGPIEALSMIGAPRPFVSAALNVAGDTSLAAAGLEWRFNLSEAWSLNTSFGYALHNGEVSNPYPNGDPRATQFTNEHVLLGSRDLFRTGIVASRKMGENWSAEAIYVHYSHGQILGNGRNQSINQLGLRVRYSLE
ncbi:MAG: hypothetical protein ACOYKM_11360 [Caulobacterales bacterium]|jgi:lipid A 3-O-deacylase